MKIFLNVCLLFFTSLSIAMQRNTQSSSVQMRSYCGAGLFRSITSLTTNIIDYFSPLCRNAQTDEEANEANEALIPNSQNVRRGDSIEVIENRINIEDENRLSYLNLLPEGIFASYVLPYLSERESEQVVSHFSRKSHYNNYSLKPLNMRSEDKFYHFGLLNFPYEIHFRIFKHLQTKDFRSLRLVCFLFYTYFRSEDTLLIRPRLRVISTELLSFLDNFISHETLGNRNLVTLRLPANIIRRIPINSIPFFSSEFSQEEDLSDSRNFFNNFQKYNKTIRNLTLCFDGYCLSPSFGIKDLYNLKESSPLLENLTLHFYDFEAQSKDHEVIFPINDNVFHYPVSLSFEAGDYFQIFHYEKQRNKIKHQLMTLQKFSMVKNLSIAIVHPIQLYELVKILSGKQFHFLESFSVTINCQNVFLSLYPYFREGLKLSDNGMVSFKSMPYYDPDVNLHTFFPNSVFASDELNFFECKVNILSLRKLMLLFANDRLPFFKHFSLGVVNDSSYSDSYLDFIASMAYSGFLKSIEFLSLNVTGISANAKSKFLERMINAYIKHKLPKLSLSRFCKFLTEQTDHDIILEIINKMRLTEFPGNQEKLNRIYECILND